MRIYLDNNIIVSIEDKEIELDFFRKKPSENIEYIYSYAHISELLEANDESGELTKHRINTIRSVTNNCYSFSFGDSIEFKTEDPQFVIEVFKRFPDSFNTLKNSIKKLNPDRERLIKLLKIDKKRINNYSTSEVVNHYDSLLKSKTPINFTEMIHVSGSTLHSRIYATFNFLDFLGYWSDKKNSKSNIARYNDASHVFFASGCDYFISNDLRARNKAKVAYDLFNIETEVYSFEEYKKIKGSL